MGSGGIAFMAHRVGTLGPWFAAAVWGGTDLRGLTSLGTALVVPAATRRLGTARDAVGRAQAAPAGVYVVWKASARGVPMGSCLVRGRHSHRLTGAGVCTRRVRSVKPSQ